MPEFEFKYVSAGLLRSEPDQFLVDYRDAQGRLTFHGYEYCATPMVYVPRAADWDATVPDRKGQRDLIAGRLLKYLRDIGHSDDFRASVEDPAFFDALPKQRRTLKHRWQAEERLARRLDAEPDPPEQTRSAWKHPFIRWPLFAAGIAIIAVLVVMKLKQTERRLKRYEAKTTPAEIL